MKTTEMLTFCIGNGRYSASFVASVKDFDLLLEFTEITLHNECSAKVKYIPSEKTLTPTTRVGGGMKGYFPYSTTNGKSRIQSRRW